MSEVEFSDAFIVMDTGAVNGMSCLATVQPDEKYRHQLIDPLAVLIAEEPMESSNRVSSHEKNNEYIHHTCRSSTAVLIYFMHPYPPLYKNSFSRIYTYIYCNQLVRILVFVTTTT